MSESVKLLCTYFKVLNRLRCLINFSTATSFACRIGKVTYEEYEAAYTVMCEEYEAAYMVTYEEYQAAYTVMYEEYEAAYTVTYEVMCNRTYNFKKLHMLPHIPHTLPSTYGNV